MRIKSFYSVHKQSYKALCGFTLIELMLVILVISLLTLYAVRMMNANLINKQVSRAASQIQSIKQASIAYYMAMGSQWPNNLTQLTQPVLPSGQSIPGFLQSTALCSSFSQSTASDSCGYSIAYTTAGSPNNNYFTFQLVLPSKDLATRLSVAVNNSWVTSDATLNIAVPRPAIIGQLKNRGWIVSAGLISTMPYSTDNPHYDGSKWVYYRGYGALIELPDCPSGYEGHVFFSPQNYQTSSDFNNGTTKAYIMHMVNENANSYSTNDTGSFLIDMNGSPYTYATTTDRFNHISRGVMIADRGMTQQGLTFVPHFAYFMTYCIPGGHWDTFWIDSNFTQDGQCSYSGRDYSWNNYRYATTQQSGVCRDSYDSTDYPSSAPTRLGAAEAT